jgi:hypothetical protein
MKLYDLLEAPLKDISVHDAEQTGSFSQKDKDLIKKLITKKVYHEKLSKVPMDLYVYVLDAIGVKEIAKEFPEGEIWFKNGDFYSPKLRAKNGGDTNLFLRDVHFEYIFHDIRDNIKKNSKSVHFIMGDNYSPENQISPTPWMLIHRFCHTIPDPVVPRQIRSLDLWDSKNIFTFKSTEKLSDRSEFETELMTQFILTGDIPIKPKFKGMDDDEREELIKAVDEYKINISKVIKELPGRIFYI